MVSKIATPKEKFTAPKGTLLTVSKRIANAYVNPKLYKKLGTFNHGDSVISLGTFVTINKITFIKVIGSLGPCWTNVANFI